MTDTIKIDCQCGCARTQFAIHTQTFVRFRCHCDICKRVYQANYSDFLVVNAASVSMPNGAPVNYKKYRMPPALDRGTCQHCHQAAIGFLTLLPGVKLAFVPTKNVRDAQYLPELRGHLFYNQRHEDANDSVKKHSGYVKSEWAVVQAAWPLLFS